MAKADCQTAMTAAEAALATLQKQEDDTKSNGPDSREYALTALAARLVEVRAQIELLA